MARSWEAEYQLGREYQKSYRAAHREEHRAANVAWRAANKPKVAQYSKTWRARTGGGRAHDAVHRAVLEGRLTKTPCRCGSSIVEAHHHLGYAREHHLDVVWLCHLCHMAEHHES